MVGSPAILVLALGVLLALLVHLQPDTLHVAAEGGNTASLQAGPPPRHDDSQQHHQTTGAESPAAETGSNGHGHPHVAFQHGHEAACGDLTSASGPRLNAADTRPATLLWVVPPFSDTADRLPPPQPHARTPHPIADLGIQRV